jgi:lipid-A-disaccharide synthase
MKYYLIAGEASGDMHAANLIRAMKSKDPEADFRCFGGDMMKDAGAVLHIHYREMAMMGLVEVLRKYPIIRKNKKKCRQDILIYKPDVLILVDYSGFNLPMARFAAKNHIPVIYYISPKLWAWAKWRVKTVRDYILKMFVILPFEVDFYREHQVEAEYYGNPVLVLLKIAIGPVAISEQTISSPTNLLLPCWQAAGNRRSINSYRRCWK